MRFQIQFPDKTSLVNNQCLPGNNKKTKQSILQTKRLTGTLLKTKYVCTISRIFNPTLRCFVCRVRLKTISRHQAYEISNLIRQWTSWESNQGIYNHKSSAVRRVRLSYSYTIKLKLLNNVITRILYSPISKRLSRLCQAACNR